MQHHFGSPMKSLLALFLLLSGSFAHSRVEVLFHPLEPTLEKVASWIQESESTIDIAMYNMDVRDTSPVMQALSSRPVQARLRSGQLKIRMLFEGSGQEVDSDRKRQVLEDLGVDVRVLGLEVKIHHKFAVIDSFLKNNRVITGSANWTVASFKNYHENILFVTEEPEVTARYQAEFLRLWKSAKEFGKVGASSPNDLLVPNTIDQPDVRIHFNAGKNLKNEVPEDEITTHLVKLIDSAQSTIQIASARVRRRPLLQALVRAADRGVQINIVLSQDDWRDLKKRSRYLMGRPNMEVRIKFYDLHPDNFIGFQMHNKYALVDGKTLWTGSFNWSDSSENKYIENVIELSGALAQEVMPAYQLNFKNIWSYGRSLFAPLLVSLKANQHPACAFAPMVLTPDEITALIPFGASCK